MITKQVMFGTVRVARLYGLIAAEMEVVGAGVAVRIKAAVARWEGVGCRRWWWLLGARPAQVCPSGAAYRGIFSHAYSPGGLGRG